MKILYVSPNAELGGAERIVEILLRHHDRSAFTPAVVFLRDGELLQRWRDLGVETHLLPFKRMRRIDRLVYEQLKFIRFLRRNAIELVHSTMAYGHVFAGIPARIAGVPETWFQHGPGGGTLDKIAGKIPTEMVLCNSRHTRDEQAHFSGHASKIVYGPVELPNFSNADREKRREHFRSQYGIAASEFLVIHVARLDSWKGQRAFIEGFARAQAAANLRMKALIIGGAELGSETYERSLKELVRALKLEHAILFTGALRDVSPAYLAADLFVHSSTQPEPLGLTVLEAMAHGCPVIASARGGPGEIFTHEKDCLLLSESNESSIQRAILQMLESAQKRTAFARAATERIREFEAQTWTRKIEGLYRELSQLHK